MYNTLPTTLLGWFNLTTYLLFVIIFYPIVGYGLRTFLFRHKARLPGWLKPFIDWEKKAIDLLQNNGQELSECKTLLRELQNLDRETHPYKKRFSQLHRALKKKHITWVDCLILEE